MAEAMTESMGHVAHHEENYLDFELGGEQAEPAGDMAGSNLPDGGQESEVVADDFDFQFDELDEGGEQTSLDDSHVEISDAPHGELGVPQDNIAISEIDYEEDEKEPTQALTDPIGLQQPVVDDKQSHDDTNDPVDNVDEITYDETDLDDVQVTAATSASNLAHESDMAPLADQEFNVSNPASQEEINDVSVDDTAQEDVGPGDEGQVREPSVADDQDLDNEASAGQAHDEQHLPEEYDDPEWAEGDRSHGVIATYKGREYELFASTYNTDPDTYFFAGTEEIDYPLSQMFYGIRNILGDEIEATDELVLAIEEMDLVIRSGSDEEFLSGTTMRDILHLYAQLQLNDGVTDEPTLFVQLIARAPCESRFRLLSEAAIAGRGLSEFCDNSEQSDMASGQYSDEESVNDTASPEDQSGGADADVTMEAVEVVGEALFYGETNDIDNHTGEDAGIFEGDVGVETISAHGDEMPQEYMLQGEGVDEIHVRDFGNLEEHPAEGEADQDSDEFDQNPEQDAATDNADNNDSNDSEPILNTEDDVHQSTEVEYAEATSLYHGDGDELEDELEGLEGEVGSAVAASDSFTTGKHPFSVCPLATTTAATERDIIDEDFEFAGGELPAIVTSWNVSAGYEDYDLVDYSDGDEIAGDSQSSAHDSTKSTDIRYHMPGDEDLIDYSDDEFDSSATPSTDTAAGCGISGSFTRTEFHSETVHSDGQYNETCPPATISMLPGSPASVLPEQPSAQPCFSSPYSSPLHAKFSCSPNTTANLSDLQVQPDLDNQPETVIEPRVGSTASSLAGEGPDDSMLDEGGEANYDFANEDVANSGQAVDNTIGQVTSSKTTSNTSTLHGDEDEIDYDDDDVPAERPGSDVDHIVEDPNQTLDEIDWENDQEDAETDAQNSTNPMSPGLSAKRSRETDDGFVLDDKNGTPAKRQKL